MRVIAGIAKGAKLVAPSGRDVRPTLDRVREALFSILGPDMEGAAFLDLFAGTGANGIEALSRGAALAVLVENDERSLTAIRQNLQAARVAVKARVVRATLPEGLQRLPAELSPFDFIFADPPYVYSDFEGLLRNIKERHLLADQGLIILEHSARVNLPGEIGAFSSFRRSVYGDTALTFFS